MWMLCVVCGVCGVRRVCLHGVQCVWRAVCDVCPPPSSPEPQRYDPACSCVCGVCMCSVECGVCGV